VATLQAVQQDAIVPEIKKLEGGVEKLMLELKTVKESKLELKGEMRDLRKEAHFWLILLIFVGFGMVCFT